MFNLHICCIIYDIAALLQLQLQLQLVSALCALHCKLSSRCPSIHPPVCLCVWVGESSRGLAHHGHLLYLRNLFYSQGSKQIAQLATGAVSWSCCTAFPGIICWSPFFFFFVLVAFGIFRVFACLCLLVDALRWVLANRIYLSIKLSLHYGYCPCSCRR